MVKLGDVIRTQKGKKPKVLVSKPEPNYLPYIDIKAFEQNKFDNYTDGEKCLPCDEGDLLIVWDGARCGLTGLAHKGYVGSTLQKIWIPNVDNKYLLYFLRSKYTILNSKNQGSGTPHIKPEILMNFIIPLPPLAEQHRIVAKIEELFLELDRGIAGLEKAKAQLKTYRQAVLHDIFEKTEPDDIVYLGTLIEKPRYGSAKKCISERNQGALPVYRIPNIDYASGKINQDDLKYAVFDDNEINVLKLKENDILIIRSNGSVSLVGRAAIITDDDILGLFAGYLMRIRINDSTIVSPKYLLYCLQTPIIRNYIENTAKSTSGVNNINSGEIMRIQIPLFPIDNQYQIVSEIETRLSFCDSLEKSIDSSLKNADLLRMSILKKAFAGELVGQDPADAPSLILSKENT
ncbi:MAG: restriction endonuclease subunit S [Methanocorpusculum sp.]|nr:restriction endonuclease subunit S [Methanocorpusculum sp.]